LGYTEKIYGYQQNNRNYNWIANKFQCTNVKAWYQTI